MAPQLGCPACICFPAVEGPLPFICSTIGLPVLRVESLPTLMLPLPTTAVLLLMNGFNAPTSQKVARYRLSPPGISLGSRPSPEKIRPRAANDRALLRQWQTT